MAQPIVTTYSLVAAVANGVAQSQTPGAAGNLTLNGSLVTDGVAVFDNARRVGVASAGNDATVVFTIYGTDRYGNTQTETVTGVNADTVQTQQDFKTVTRVAVSAATVGAITVGTTSTGSTAWITDNIHFGPFYIGIWVYLTGSATYSVEITPDDPNSQIAGSIEPASTYPPVAYPLSNMTNLSTTAQGYIGPIVPFAHRLTITAGTGTAKMTSIQAGIVN